MATENVEIRQVLVLSLSHITESTWLHFKAWPLIANYEDGCYFYVGETPEQNTEAPDDLKAVLLFAKQHGCTEVKLDKDAQIISELPWFDW